MSESHLNSEIIERLKWCQGSDVPICNEMEAGEERNYPLLHQDRVRNDTTGLIGLKSMESGQSWFAHLALRKMYLKTLSNINTLVFILLTVLILSYF